MIMIMITRMIIIMIVIKIMMLYFYIMLFNTYIVTKTKSHLAALGDDPFHRDFPQINNESLGVRNSALAPTFLKSLIPSSFTLDLESNTNW